MLPQAQGVFNFLCPLPHWWLLAPLSRSHALHHCLTWRKYLNFLAIMLFISQFSPMLKSHSMLAFFSFLVHIIQTFEFLSLKFLLLDCEMVHNSHLSVATKNMHVLCEFLMSSVCWCHASCKPELTFKATHCTSQFPTV